MINLLHKKNKKRGEILITVLIFAMISLAVVTGIVSWFVVLMKSSKHLIARETAFQIAESGAEYYKWHLAHAKEDYQDGTGTSGPYVHPFFDKDGKQLGSFTLEITPPPIGTSIVTVKSTGKVLDDDSASRTIVAKFAVPSLAKYSIVANDNMRFGEGTIVFGELLSNKGIRFDGLAHNLVSSAKATYDDPDTSGTVEEFGVHTHVKALPLTGMYSDSELATGEYPPAVLSQRSDIFAAGRQVSVPAADFNGMVADMALLKASTTAENSYAASGGTYKGYNLILRTDDKYDIYKVKATESDCSGNPSWSIKSMEIYKSGVALPSNGIIFVSDNVWVEGKINTARITIVASRFLDNTDTNIIVNNDLLYTNYDGQDVVSLIAQKNINVGLKSEDNLKIDAALIAQSGRVGRFYYGSSCTGYRRSSLSLYGMIATNLRYGFGYTDGTGYQNRTISYDANLLYGPPPGFPKTSDQYQIISWQEE